MPLLHFLDGSRPPLELADGELLVGSGPACAVRLEDAAVAAEHARIVAQAGAVSIQDLDSFSGTLRNGEFVYGKQPLSDGDVIQVGPFKLKYGRAAMPSAFESEDQLVTPPLGMPVLDEDDERDGRTVQMDTAEIEALMRMSPPPSAAPAASDGPAPLPPPPAAPPPAAAPLAIEAPKEAPKQRTAAAYNATLPPVSRDDLERIKKQAAARRTMIGLPAPAVPTQQRVLIKTPAQGTPAVAAPAPAPVAKPPELSTAKTMALEAPRLDAPIPVSEQPTGKNRGSDSTAKTMTFSAPPVAPPPPAAAPAPSTALVPAASSTTAPIPLVEGRSWWRRLLAFFRRLFRR